MSVDKEDIKKISRLARIKINDNQIEDTKNKINNIVGWFEQLGELKTDNIDILTNIHNQKLKLHEDEVNDGNISEDILKNSKDAKYGYFSVPKIL